MTASDRERTPEEPPPAVALLFFGFVVVWTVLAGFFFMFGIVFSLLMVGLTSRALLNGQPAGNLWPFFAIAVPMMIVYQWVSWRFFRVGLAFLRGNSRRHDPFDANGKPKQSPTEAD